MGARRSAGGGAGSSRRVLKVRSGDQVRVTAGKDRGKSGRILRVEPKKERVYVEGLNMVKRHTRPQQAQNNQQAAGGVIEREGPIHVSNVMLLDAKDQPTRVRIERENGRRFRVAKSSGARLD
jgi:large subunit ribosomal protein L24